MSTPSAPKRALGLQTKVLMLVLLPLLLVTVVLVGFKAYSSAQDTRDTLANQREMLIEERRHAVRDIVQMATSAIEPIYEQAGANDEAAKQQVAELVRSMRLKITTTFLSTTMTVTISSRRLHRSVKVPT